MQAARIYSFKGQQTGERILHVIRPHYLHKTLAIARDTAIMFLFAAAWTRSGTLVSNGNTLVYFGVWALILGVYAVALWWSLKVQEGLRSYITDRRIVRIKPVFPVMESRRALFWKDVLKTRTDSRGFFNPILKVGQVAIVPGRSGEEEITLSLIENFEELGNYFDTLVYLTATEPAKLKEIQPLDSLMKGELAYSVTLEERSPKTEPRLIVGQGAQLSHSGTKQLPGS